MLPLTLPSVRVVLLLWTSLAALVGCGGGAQPEESVPELENEITLNGFAPANGIFDPAPTVDGGGRLWMSYSAVKPSPASPVLAHVSTRIARSADGGLSWQDIGVAPNRADDFLVPDGAGGSYQATWHYEVSRLVYDPHDPQAERRWKLLWHRFLGVEINGQNIPLFDHSWIGLSTAPAPEGPWSGERKLFVGAGYNADSNDVLGAPQIDLSAYPAVQQCLALTEPGVLVKSDALYISLKCGSDTAGKIFLLRCDRGFTASGCDYRGDFLLDDEAARFQNAGQDFAGFSASEMFTVGAKDYLMVTPNTPSEDLYRGCLVFEISDLNTAGLKRQAGEPVLLTRIEGIPGSFRGACGYHTALSASGVLLSQHSLSVPNFHIVATGVQLP